MFFLFYPKTVDFLPALGYNVLYSGGRFYVLIEILAVSDNININRMRSVKNTVFNEATKMFREMRRFKQQISDAECVKLLIGQPRGILSMIGDDGYPYGIPLDHWYSEKDGKLYFHCAKAGHKMDAIARCDKVSYCVMDEGFRREGEWALNIKSVVIFGRIRVVDDDEKKLEICTELSRKFTSDEEYIKKETESAFSRVACLELTIEHMTGKLVNES